MVAFAASATTYTVTIDESDIAWYEGDSYDFPGQVYTKIPLEITNLLKKGDQVKITYSGGIVLDTSYTAAIVDNSAEANYWYELSDWSHTLKFNASGSGSTTITITETAKDSESIIAVLFFANSGYIISDTTKNWDFQYEGLFYKIQPDGTAWVTHGSSWSKTFYNVTVNYYGHASINMKNPDYYYYLKSELPTENIIIPAKVSHNGVEYLVSGIDDHAFGYSTIYDGYYSKYNEHLLQRESLEIPATIKTIGSYAFEVTSLFIESVESFSSIHIDKNNYDLYENLYENHKVITKLEIPETITSLDKRFSCCKNLTSIMISDNTDVTSSGLYFEKNGVRYHILNEKEVDVVEKDGESNYPNDIVIPGTVSAGNTFSVISIKYGAFKGCTTIESVIIGENVDSINNNAFIGCTNLKSVIIGESVEYIGSNAFSGCSSLSKITCYAVEPPTVNESSFSNYNGYLTIPCDNFESYDIHAVWGSFKHVDCLCAQSIDIEEDDIIVEPDVLQAAFSMPTNEEANSYTLTITNNGLLVCSITFNAQGQLANIDFSTTKSYELKASVSAYQFTITGLTAATVYGYSFKALNKSNTVLKEYTGTFTTKNEDGTGGSSSSDTSDQGDQGSQGSSTAINSISNTTTVAIIGNQIFVNGVAPTFVVTISGKKIANNNLKSGAYFVNGENGTVKVLIQ